MVSKKYDFLLKFIKETLTDVVIKIKNTYYLFKILVSFFVIFYVTFYVIN